MRNFKAVAWEKKTQLERWLHDLNLKSSDFIRLASVFGVGFLCGLLVRRYAKYIVLIGISLVMLLALLQGFAFITINIAKIQRITGLQDITNLGNVFLVLGQATKKYALELSCSSVGFILGLKTG